MRWVLMLFVILAAVMGGEARAVVVMGRMPADPLAPTTFTGSRAAAHGFRSGSPTGPIRTFEVNASNLKR
jgi:hypothetical protein